MKTKLDILVKILIEENEEQEIINNLIIDYFQDQNNSEFSTKNGRIYEVLNNTEIKEKLYEVALEVFNDIYTHLEDLSIKCPFIQPSTFNSVLENINKDDAIESIVDTLDYEEEFDVIFMGEIYSNSVFRFYE